MERSSTDWPQDSTRHRFAVVATVAVLAAVAMILIALVVLSRFKQRCAQQHTPHVMLPPVYIQLHNSAADAAAVAPQTTVQGAPHHIHDPSPAYEDLASGSGILVPAPAYVHSSQEVSSSDRSSDGAPVFGSVQYRGSHRGPQRTHPAQQEIGEARESVDTLPRYDDPPSYTSGDTPLESAQRMN